MKKKPNQNNTETNQQNQQQTRPKPNNDNGFIFIGYQFSRYLIGILGRPQVWPLDGGHAIQIHLNGEEGGGRREEGGGRREAVGRNGHQGQVGGAEPFLNPCLTGRLANLSPSMEDALRDALQGCSPGMLQSTQGQVKKGIRVSGWI